MLTVWEVWSVYPPDVLIRLQCCLTGQVLSEPVVASEPVGDDGETIEMAPAPQPEAVEEQYVVAKAHSGGGWSHQDVNEAEVEDADTIDGIPCKDSLYF